MEIGLRKLLHKLFQQHPSIHPILAPPKVGLNLQLSMHQRMCPTTVLAEVLEAAQAEMNFRVFVCGYRMKVPAQEFSLDVLKVAYSDMASAVAYFKLNLLLLW